MHLFHLTETRIINLDHVIEIEWWEKERQLFLTTTGTDNDDETGNPVPYLTILFGDEAQQAWEALSALVAAPARQDTQQRYDEQGTTHNARMQLFQGARGE